MSSESSSEWSWNHTYAFSLALDYLALEYRPRGVSVPDLFRCRAVCKHWKTLIDHNYGERWHLCVPASVHGSKMSRPRAQLLKCLFMKGDMNLCTQRRHLAEAYYLVYLHDKKHLLSSKCREGTYPYAPESNTHYDNEEMVTRDLRNLPNRLESLLQETIQAFRGFRGVSRPTLVALRRFCDELYLSSSAHQNQPVDVLECIDTIHWRYISNDPDEGPYLRRKVTCALWLYCCAYAEVDREITAEGASTSRLPSGPSS